jgi:hypothetical protein
MIHGQQNVKFANYVFDKNYLSKIIIVQIAVFWYVRTCKTSKKCWKQQLLQLVFSMKAYGEAELQICLLFTLAPYGGEVSALRYDRWAQEPV